MDLFDPLIDPEQNLLPRNGQVHYYGPFMPAARADTALATLLGTIAWVNDEAVIYGKRIVTRRKVAWYGDRAFDYSYSGATKSALPWTRELLALKRLAERTSGERFNSCLLNLYHDGSEGMTWHSDTETALSRHGAIASVSLGAQRKFSFKHRITRETISVVLQHGSLLVMKGVTQSHWLHRLPTTTRVSEPRVNLTFRTIKTD